MIGDFLRVCDLAGWKLFDKKKGGHESSLKILCVPIVAGFDKTEFIEHRTDSG